MAVAPGAARRALAVAAAFLAGPWDASTMATRAADRVPGRDQSWWRPLADDVLEAFPVPVFVEPDTVVDLGELATWIKRRRRRFLALPPPPPHRIEPRWPVLPIEDLAHLREAFGLGPTHLDWYADVASLERSAPDEALRHYSYRWVPTRSGSHRLLEAPKPMLRFFQRRILHEVLDAIPLHDAAHGFVRGRSVHTFVAPHVGRPVVIRLDLEGFFASIRAGRVHSVLKRIGYSDQVAHRLTGLMTNAVPLAVLERRPSPTGSTRDQWRRQARHLAHPHLPQGAPTSPALANLVAFRLDRRLAGVARTFGGRYTRYADDLAFSGPFRVAAAQRLVEQVAVVVRDEGFRLHPAKQRIATSARRQVLTGLVVNERPNVDRATYDQLRAVLHDAARHGPDHANRDGHPMFRDHLLGRITWVEQANPGRGPRLRALFDRIDW